MLWWSLNDMNGQRNPLTRTDWIAAARGLLVAGGIEHVRIARLSETLNVTRGGFYWLFKSRDDLLNELLKDWERTNTRPFEKILKPEHNGLAELETLIDMWLDEADYSPAYDSAIRDWARMSSLAARVVKRVDAKRIKVIKTIFLDMGYAEDEALVRARITYFHQVGYYILGLGESRAKRRKARPLYMKVLSGQDKE
ncbi:TetR/AcrR family transcriptional regulator [Pseudomonadota bacterium]